jgi:hypothetical protein
MPMARNSPREEAVEQRSPAHEEYVQFHAQLPEELYCKLVESLRLLGYVKKRSDVNLTEWLRTKARETIREAETRYPYTRSS